VGGGYNPASCTASTLHSEHYAPIVLDTVGTQAVVWRLREWCIDLGILDELVMATRASIPDTAVQIIFPIRDARLLLDQRDFETKMLAHFWDLATHSTNYWAVSVPELLRALCPREHIAVVAAKERLTLWLATHRASTLARVFSPSTAMPRWERNRDANGYESLLKGYVQSPQEYISHIGILDQAVKKGLFDRPIACRSRAQWSNEAMVKSRTTLSLEDA